MTGVSLPGMGATLSANDSNVSSVSGASALGIPVLEVPVIEPTFAGPLVTMTERAEEKAMTMLAEKGHTQGMLRVFVVGGGCSGWQYGMAIAEKIDEGDTVIVTDGGARIVVDADSVPMIGGAEVDYVEDLMKSGFTIYNPNATASCACGSSFQASGGTPRPC
jgi:iron-sulfur cluster assembly protein